MTTIILKENKSSYFTLIRYPDGQKSIKINLAKLDIKQTVRIVCRIKSFDELEVLLCLVAALRKNDYQLINIEFMYLFGMRSDRAFNVGEPNYFRDVVAPIINSMNVHVEIFFPHSDISMRSLSNAGAYEDLDRLLWNSGMKDHCLLIGGDRSFGDKHRIMAFDKKRSDSGIHIELRQKDMELLYGNNVNEVMICDDLCDGGATFVAGAEYLKRNFPHMKINLFIIHALFTNGVDTLMNHFDHIFYTDSYREIPHPKATVIKLFGAENYD